MGKLLDYALEDGDFKAIFTQENFKTSSTLDHPEGILLESTVLSKLHGRRQDGFEILGGKSGTTSQAGQSWISLGVKNNQEYLAVVMGAEFKDYKHLNDHQIDDTIKIFENIN